MFCREFILFYIIKTSDYKFNVLGKLLYFSFINYFYKLL